MAVRYENPEIPEGINRSTEHPLKDFALLSLGVFGSLALLLWLLMLAIGWWAPLIPFSWEAKWLSSSNIDLYIPKDSSDTDGTLNTSAPDMQTVVISKELSEQQRIESHLNTLANTIVEAMTESEGQTERPLDVHVHYIEDDTVNAIATLGGHIFIHQGLLKRLNSENAVAMLLGHEIAHIIHRDPIVALARSLGTGTVLTLISGMSDLGDIKSILGTTTALTSLCFSREQESLADRDALIALQALYGHVAGATELFEELKSESAELLPEFLSTHPLSDERIEALQTFIAENNWPTSGKLTEATFTIGAESSGLTTKTSN